MRPVRILRAVFRRKTGPKLWFGLAGTAVIGVYLYDKINMVRGRFTHILPRGVLDIRKKGPAYIYVDESGPRGTTSTEEVPREAMLVSDLQVSSQWHTVKSDIPLVWDPDKSTRKEDYWQILKQAKSNNVEERVDAINKLSKLIDHMHISECTQVGQASDDLIAIGLARSNVKGTDCLLKPPPVPDCKEEEIERKFRTILASLPDSEVEDCVGYITRHAMEKGHFYSAAGSGGDWYFGSETGMKGKSMQRIPQDVMKRLYLEALHSHSTVPSHRKLIVERGGLVLLMQVYVSCNSKLEDKSLILQIIANICLDENLIKEMYRSGWVKLLAKMLRNPEIELNLPAARALCNLDRDVVKPKYKDGIYILHPSYRHEDNELTADVVFVHGISGGVFKTWRQRDVALIPETPLTEGQAAAAAIPLTPGDIDRGIEMRRDILMVAEDMSMKSSKRFFPGQQAIQEAQETEYEQQFKDWLKILLKKDEFPKTTHCWPKDWLPKDCPLVRVVAVDFDAQMSEWVSKCPVTPEKRSLINRSQMLLTKLLQAEIGKRPVIWVTHSMGGLLVKKMLVTAQASEDPTIRRVWDQTKGVVFFGVPHRGSLWASWGGTEMLLLPSAEVQELKYNSPQLLELNIQFQDMAEKVRLPCLSFGETLKTSLGYKLEALFVAPNSADPGFGVFYTVGTDHVNVCKPVNRRSKLYLRTLEFVYDNIPHTIFDTLMAPRFGKIDYDKIMDSYMMW